MEMSGPGARPDGKDGKTEKEEANRKRRGGVGEGQPRPSPPIPPGVRLLRQESKHPQLPQQRAYTKGFLFPWEEEEG